MSRKDFVRIAAVLRAVKPGTGAPEAAFAQWFATVNEMTDALKGTNERFDAERFQIASGMA